jgi:glucose-6-phosphate 1-epimerase
VSRLDGVNEAGQAPASVIVARAEDGASVEVHRNGAHVSSWRPAPGTEERLFLSAKSSLADGASIRGGIPVIFPQFSMEGPLPRHGFARNSAWTHEDTRHDDGDAVVSFSLSDSPATRAIWPATFRASLSARVRGPRLATTLDIENTGSEPFHFAVALHTYLRVDDVRQTEIIGLVGSRYRVSSAPQTLVTDTEEVLHIRGEVDRVYVDAPGRLIVREPKRQLVVSTTNFPDVVIWNPGVERAAALADMEPGGERRMLCVEAAVVQRPITLDARQRWSGTQVLTVEPRDP